MWEALARRLEGDSSSDEGAGAEGHAVIGPDSSKETRKPQKKGEKKRKAATQGLEPVTIVEGTQTPLKTTKKKNNRGAAVLEGGDACDPTGDGKSEVPKRKKSKGGSSSAGEGVLQDQGDNEVVPPVHEDRAGEKKSKSKGKSTRVGSVLGEHGNGVAPGQVDPRGIKGGITKGEAGELNHAPRNREGQTADTSGAAEAVNG